MPNRWRIFSRWLRLRRRLWRWRRAATKRPLQAEEPLRSQLFNAEQMELHGKALARSHRVHSRPGPERLLDRLKENEGLLDDASTLLTRMVQDEMRITPAGEWLLDNYYLVEEQIHTARRHLPKGYSRELPSLTHGPSAGLPRVYDLSLEAIAHGDGRIDAETISRFVAAYQSVTPLKLGELWAIPIMLRLALIDNLRRMAVRVMRDGVDHRLASEWADLLNETAAENPKDVVLVVADMARSGATAVGRLRLRADPRAAGPRLRCCRCRSPGWNSGSSTAATASRNWCTWKASNRPPTRSRSATASAACASWPTWTGANSSRA